MDFNAHIRNQVPVEIGALLDEFVQAAALFTQKSVLLEVPYQTPAGDVSDVFNRYVELIEAAYIAKFSALTRSTIASVNQLDFFTYALTGRSMIEHTAVFRYYQKNLIAPRLRGLPGMGADPLRNCSTSLR